MHPLSDYHEEIRLKEAAMEREQQSAPGGMMGNGTSAALNMGLEMGKELARPSLMERVYRQRCRAQQEARQAERLSELQFLLEKNPEVARILDLMDSLES